MEWEGKADQEELGTWLEERWPDSIIRIFDNGEVEFAVNRPDMVEIDEGVDGRLSNEDLPGDWAITSTWWGRGGVSYTIEMDP